jgi:hypothetical protein
MGRGDAAVAVKWELGPFPDPVPGRKAAIMPDAPVVAARMPAFANA